LETFTAESAWRALSTLDVLARFVFVLRNFEGYSAREIALLLDVGPTTLECAYRRAIEVIGVEQQVSGDRTGGRSVPIIRKSAKPDDVGLQQGWEPGTLIGEGDTGFCDALVPGQCRNARTKHPQVLAAEVRALR
jgi:hypothetical protein